MPTSRAQSVCGANTRTCSTCGHHQREHPGKQACQAQHPHVPLGEICACRLFVPGRCTQRKLAGRDRCRLHGGKSLTGPAHPSFKDGKRIYRYAEVLRGRLRALYEEAEQADDLLTTRHQIVLKEARKTQLLEQVVGEEHVHVGACDTWRDVEEARRLLGQSEPGSPGHRAASRRVAEAIHRHGEAMGAVSRNAGAWEEIHKIDVLLDRLRRTERELQEARYRVFTAEQAFGLMRALELSVKGPIDKHVVDPEVRSALLREIATGLAELTARRADPALVP